MKKMKEDKAAGIIQNFWRKNNFYNQFLLLLNSTPAEINQSLFNNVFSRMIKYCERLQVYSCIHIERDEKKSGYDHAIKTNLKMIAHALFAPPLKNITCTGDLYNLRTLLWFLFADKKSLSTDIIHILKNAFTILSSSSELKISTGGGPKHVDLKELTEKAISEKKETYWGEQRGIKKTDVVTIVHSGGHQCIRGFLYHKKPGYALEANKGLGLQVIVEEGKLSYGQALENFTVCKYRGRKQQSILALDDHATFFAHIEAQYLLPANNGNEAGLRSEFIQYLRSIKVEKLVSGHSEINYVLFKTDSSLTDFLQDLGSTEPAKEFSQRCKTSVDRVHEISRYF